MVTRSGSKSHVSWRRERSSRSSRAEILLPRESYREPYRALAAEALSQIDPVDIFGNVTGAPLLQSKYEALRDYRFN